MELNQTPNANRVHIGIFGKRNAGKSSLINALTGQDVAVVSEIAGTTTDPVTKAMELPPLGPVLLIDTPGIDDAGELGRLRVQKARQALNKTDVAVLVVDAAAGRGIEDEELLRLFEQKDIPYIVAYNKCDVPERLPMPGEREIYVSAARNINIGRLKEQIAALAAVAAPARRIVGDLLQAEDLVLLVTPLDAAAPKGRLILPQQQTIRDILESDAIALVTKEFQLPAALACLAQKPRLVITDSQVFARVAADVPPQIPLTSFSILFARYKGLLDSAVRGAVMLDSLGDKDTVLIAEGCTHHRQCDDIGTVKLPGWIRRHTGKQPRFEFASGGGFPEELQKYRLIIHCGGCMLNDREVDYRRQCALDQGVAITNYGIAIAHMQGILKRSLEIFSQPQQDAAG
ncbi:MAG: [FeFe] hydrogenase H-cluster maturation GTPase HydF [Clostridia bacterium]|nr:[FeFe] hydrogenase H-cluster maturation GTPase HydF [Clostridia bacterium]